MLEVARSAYDAVLDHAHEDVPHEACGVLAGRHRDRGSVVQSAVRVRNAAEAPRVRYRIDPTELLAVVDEIEALDREVIGFYHSHPAGPPTPSDRDRSSAHWPDHYYVLVSLAGSVPSFDTWRWTGDTFVPTPVTVGGASHH